VRVVRTADGGIQCCARDQLFAQTAPGQARLQSCRIDLYGAESESWDLTIGSLMVSQ
jgi:hypothetical protein